MNKADVELLSNAGPGFFAGFPSQYVGGHQPDEKELSIIFIKAGHYSYRICCTRLICSSTFVQ